jgi:gentisate 1,2-dioxygenase
VPSWMPLEIDSRSETVLFSFSDRPGQEAMGLWREKRG